MNRYAYILALLTLFLLPSYTNAETVITDLNKSWTIKFNADIDPKTVHADSVYVLDKYNEKIAVEYNIADQTLQVIPKESYINFWSYELIIKTTVKNHLGQPLAADHIFAFSTQKPIEELPKITAVSKGDYKNQALVTISYDDGYRNWYTNSLPLHSKYNIPATYNIIGDKIYSDDSNYMTSGQIWVADDLGIEIASHTFTHPFLTTLEPEQIHQELIQTNEFLVDLVGHVDTLAIPYSFYSNEIRDIVKNYYKGIRVYSNDTNRPDNYDPYWLKSFAVVNSMEFDTIKQWIDRAVAEKSWVIIMLHGITEDRLEEYETTPEILQDILQYINSFDKDQLLPVTTAEGLLLTEDWIKN